MRYDSSSATFPVEAATEEDNDSDWDLLDTALIKSGKY